MFGPALKIASKEAGVSLSEIIFRKVTAQIQEIMEKAVATGADFSRLAGDSRIVDDIAEVLEDGFKESGVKITKTDVFEMTRRILSAQGRHLDELVRIATEARRWMTELIDMFEQETVDALKRAFDDAATAGRNPMNDLKEIVKTASEGKGMWDDLGDDGIESLINLWLTKNNLLDDFIKLTGKNIPKGALLDSFFNIFFSNVKNIGLKRIKTSLWKAYIGMYRGVGSSFTGFNIYNRLMRMFFKTDLNGTEAVKRLILPKLKAVLKNNSEVMLEVGGKTVRVGDFVDDIAEEAFRRFHMGFRRALRLGRDVAKAACWPKMKNLTWGQPIPIIFTKTRMVTVACMAYPAMWLGEYLADWGIDAAVAITSRFAVRMQFLLICGPIPKALEDKVKGGDWEFLIDLVSIDAESMGITPEEFAAWRKANPDIDCEEGEKRMKRVGTEKKRIGNMCTDEGAKDSVIYEIENTFGEGDTPTTAAEALSSPANYNLVKTKFDNCIKSNCAHGNKDCLDLSKALLALEHCRQPSTSPAGCKRAFRSAVATMSGEVYTLKKGKGGKGAPGGVQPQMPEEEDD